jgi:hypothetical protein
VSNKNDGQENGYKIVAGKFKRWKDNIEMDLKKIRCEVVNWIHMAHRPV